MKIECIMKRLVFVLLLVLNILSCFSQEDYSNYLGKGEARYEREEYTEVKEYFEYMLEKFPSKESEMAVWVNKCDTEIGHIKHENRYINERNRKIVPKGIACLSEQKYIEAVDYLRKAANLDHVKAQLELGLMYAEGKGVEKNIKETLKWFIKAAEQGNVNAQNNLGIMYDAAGLYDEAFKWFKKQQSRD